MEKRKFPKTIQEARRQGATYYFTGEPCKHGHVCERFTSSRACRECVYKRNRERTIKENYWVDYGDEVYKERKREAARRYYQKNKHKWDEMFAKRRKQERLAKRCSTDRDKLEIKRLKLQAQLATINTGIKHEVDHIIPLIHEKVCGLDKGKNCQVLTKTANRRKAARFNQERESKKQLKLSRLYLTNRNE